MTRSWLILGESPHPYPQDATQTRKGFAGARGIVAGQIGTSPEPRPEVEASPWGHGGWSDLDEKHQKKKM